MSCYRLYDADLPEYAFAIDRYGAWVCVQEYAPPATVDALRAEVRVREVLAVVPEVLGVEPTDVYFKVRRRQRGGAQYARAHRTRELKEVVEGGHRFLVNLGDFIDTGLYLDHRLTRALIGELAAGRSFLNLFCYTATATVYAARGGAARTTSVDLSATYLDWARRNLERNGLRGRDHALVEADCLPWIEQERRRYGLVFLDAPTFSNSKRMRRELDLQRDHVTLIRKTVRLLEPGGVLLFSTHARGFALDAAALADLQPSELTKRTLPFDFARAPRTHQVWRIDRPADPAPRATPRPRR